MCPVHCLREESNAVKWIDSNLIIITIVAAALYAVLRYV